MSVGSWNWSAAALGARHHLWLCRLRYLAGGFTCCYIPSAGAPETCSQEERSFCSKKLSFSLSFVSPLPSLYRASSKSVAFCQHSWGCGCILEIFIYIHFNFLFHNFTGCKQILSIDQAKANVRCLGFLPVERS